MTSWSGSVSGAGSARPVATSSRTKCFIDTVSPTRSSVRSNTVWATRPGSAPPSAGDAVGRLKRQDSMPLAQSL